MILKYFFFFVLVFLVFSFYYFLFSSPFFLLYLLFIIVYCGLLYYLHISFLLFCVHFLFVFVFVFYCSFFFVYLEIFTVLFSTLCVSLCVYYSYFFFVRNKGEEMRLTKSFAPSFFESNDRKKSSVFSLHQLFPLLFFSSSFLSSFFISSFFRHHDKIFFLDRAECREYYLKTKIF